MYSHKFQNLYNLLTYFKYFQSIRPLIHSVKGFQFLFSHDKSRHLIISLHKKRNKGQKQNLCMRDSMPMLEYAYLCVCLLLWVRWLVALFSSWQKFHVECYLLSELKVELTEK